VKKVIVASMDWGLGHATRCVPIIRELLNQQVEVTLASSGSALDLLKMEFPQLSWIALPGYAPVYSGGKTLFLRLLIQVPGFLRIIRQEHRLIERYISENGIHAVISDNRYGCWSKQVPTVFITHQLNIPVPGWLKGLRFLVRYFNHRQIRKFGDCWVPDDRSQKLSGELSNPFDLSVKFIGPLSRFSGSSTAHGYNLDVLALISGPEPQRSLFQKRMESWLSKSSFRYKIIAGQPGIPGEINAPVIPHLKADQLQDLIEQAEVVVCRSGYSTLMDLYCLKKKMVVIPTAGQPEQEYLATYWDSTGRAICIPQDEWDDEVISRALLLNPATFEPVSSSVKTVVQELKAKM
jgi:uncharacterized protein (TIGR00661 family)